MRRSVEESEQAMKKGKIMEAWNGYNEQDRGGKGTPDEMMQFFGGATSALQILFDSGRDGGAREMLLTISELVDECLAFGDAIEEVSELLRPTKGPVN